MPRATCVTVSLSAVRHNLSRVRDLAPAAMRWAVVKADAYGHGLEGLLPAYALADGLALVEFDRASWLRKQGWRGPILMLEGAFDPADVEQARREGLSLVVHEPRQIGWLASGPALSPIDVFLKLNSGMNRLGFKPEDFPLAWSRLRGLPQCGALNLMAHFANADLPGGADTALAAFDRVTASLPGGQSLANSAAIFVLPAAHRHWVRPGIMLYGSSPFADRRASELGLRAAMRFHTRLISVQTLQPGEAVGYGSTFIAQSVMRIGIAACGYADGYPRHAPTGTPVAVDGVRTRTLGRVSMDMLALDLTPIRAAQVGSEVELWGDTIPVDEVAASAGTIAYELTCGIAPRVKRIYIDDGHQA